jgi:hypothetical protein
VSCSPSVQIHKAQLQFQPLQAAWGLAAENANTLITLFSNRWLHWIIDIHYSTNKNEHTLRHWPQKYYVCIYVTTPLPANGAIRCIFLLWHASHLSYSILAPGVDVASAAAAAVIHQWTTMPPRAGHQPSGAQHQPPSLPNNPAPCRAVCCAGMGSSCSTAELLLSGASTAQHYRRVSRPPLVRAARGWRRAWTLCTGNENSEFLWTRHLKKWVSDVMWSWTDLMHCAMDMGRHWHCAHKGDKGTNGSP